MGSNYITFSPVVFSSSLPPYENSKTRPSLQVRAHGYRDEGRSKHVVDANLCILRSKIEEVKVRERLEKCYLNEQLGWNYAHTEYYKHKRAPKLLQCAELLGIVGGAFGLTILSGSLGICVASIIAHLNQ